MNVLKKQILLATATLLTAFCASAQVKIGSNPTTIGTNRNLEVEATGGQKVYISKDAGITFIENTPAAAVTDSVLMTNATTGQVNKMSLSRLASIVGGASSSGGGGCDVMDLSLSYHAPPFGTLTFPNLGNPVTVQELDLSDMAPGQCFWDWPMGVYAVRLAKTGSGGYFSFASFCTFNHTNYAMHTSGGTHITASTTANIVPPASLPDLYRSVRIGIPKIGWLATTGSTGTNNNAIGYICRY